MQSTANESIEPDGAADYRYAAFASYSTDPDRDLVRYLEKKLERFHAQLPKRFKLRKLEIFIDGVDMGQGPNVSSLLEERLSQSNRLLVFCSRRSAVSPWVDLEIEWFLAHRGPLAIRLAVTEDFPSDKPELIFPRAIREAGLHKGLWYDFRAFRLRRWQRRPIHIQGLEENWVKLAAHLNDRSAGEIYPPWFREQRRRRRLLGGISLAALTILALSLMGMWYQAQLKYRQQVVARALDIAARANDQRQSDPEQAALVAHEAVGLLERKDLDIEATSEAQLALRRALADARLLARPWTFKGPVQRVTVSPDGGRAVAIVGSDWDAVAVWNLGAAAPDDESIRTGQRILFAAFNPFDTSELITAGEASGEQRAAVWFWRLGGAHWARSGPPLATRHTVNDVAFGGDGRSLATAEADGAVRVWDLSDRSRPPRVLLSGTRTPVRSVAYDSSATRLAALDESGTVRQWNAYSGAPVGPIFEAERGSQDLLWTTAGGRDRLVVGNPRSISLWEAERGEQVAALPQRSRVNQIALSPDTTRLAVASDDRSVLVWFLAEAQFQMRELHAGFLGVNGVVFRGDGRSLLAAGADGRASLLQTRADGVQDLVHIPPIVAAACSANGRLLATGDTQGTILLVNPQTGDRRRLHVEGSGVEALALDEGGERLLAVGRGGMATLWDTASGRQLAERQSDFEDDLVGGALRRDGSAFLTISGQTVRLWPLPVAVGAEAPVVQVARYDRAVRSAAFTSNQTVTTVAADGLYAWPATDSPRAAVEVSKAAFSARGDHVVTLAGNMARLWDARSFIGIGEPMRHDNPLSDVAVSGDGAVVATVESSGVRFWQPAIGRNTPAKQSLPDSQPATVTAVALNHDGSLAATGDKAGTVVVWDTGTADRVAVSQRHRGPVQRIVFVDDEHGADSLMTSDDDTTFIYSAEWFVPLHNLRERVCDLPRAPLTPEERKALLKTEAGGDLPCAKM